MIIKFGEIDKCLRCGTDKITISHPVIVCNCCKCIMVTDNRYYGQIKFIKFHSGNHHVMVDLIDNMTYVNGDPLINSVLPFDVTEDKIITYLVFS